MSDDTIVADYIVIGAGSSGCVVAKLPAKTLRRQVEYLDNAAVDHGELEQRIL